MDEDSEKEDDEENIQLNESDNEKRDDSNRRTMSKEPKI